MRYLTAFTISFMLHLFFIFLIFAFTNKIKPQKKANINIPLSIIKLEEEVSKKSPSPKYQKRRKKKVLKKIQKKEVKRSVIKKKQSPPKKQIKREETHKKPFRNKEILKEFKKEENPIKTTVTKREIPSTSSIPIRAEKEIEENKKTVEQKKIDEVKDYQTVFEETNLSLIREIIQSYLRYPFIARRMGWQGTVVVCFTLTPQGIRDIHVKKSSGYEVLDKKAVDTVLKASENFPKPKKEVVLVIPIVYKLN